MRAVVWFALLVACSRTAPTPTIEHARPTSPRKIEWGLYQICWGKKFQPMLEAQLPKFATMPNYVMFYRDLGRAFPKAQIAVLREKGAVPIISLELHQWMRQRKGEYLSAINKGEWDDFFRQWARDAKAEGGRVLLRFGFEMNGDWFGWSLRPEAFITAWRRAHAIMRTEVGAKNIEWVWSPNVVSVPRRSDNDLHLYYPGAATVDWVGVDGYNFGEDHDEWHRWESFASIFEAVLDDFAERYPDKPLMIAETGAAPGAGKQRESWIRAAYAFLAGRPSVKALVWFHYDKRREKEPNWRIDTTPCSLRAFNETFAR